MKEIDIAWVKKNCEYYGFDEYGFEVYKYIKLFITICETTNQIIAVEYEE